MPRLVCLALGLVFASTAAAGSGTFEVHLGVPAGGANAKAWSLRGPGGAAETVYLDAAVLLDASAIVSADTDQGPDGSPRISLVLTAAGAQKLRDITSRHVGRRLGIVVDGQLRAAPFVTAGIGSGVLVVSGIATAVEAADLARKLGPPAAPSGTARSSPIAVPDLQGSWTVLNATMNGRLVEDPKFTGAWRFKDDALTVTNGLGQTERFTLATDSGRPGAFRLAPVPTSKERGGWMIFKLEGDRLTLAFGDNLESRPDDFAPAPKKLVVILARVGPRSRRIQAVRDPERGGAQRAPARRRAAAGPGASGGGTRLCARRRAGAGSGAPGSAGRWARRLRGGSGARSKGAGRDGHG